MTDRPSNNVFVQVLDSVPSELVGWYCRVLAENDYSTVIAEVVRFDELTFQKDKNGYGGGSITIDLDDPIWSAPLPAGQTVPLIDQEAIWQIYEDGILRLEFFAEELEEKRVGEDRRVVTLAGRGVGSVLEWGIHLPFFYPTDLTTERVILGGTTMNAWLGLLWEAQARGNLTWVSETFDYAMDSRGTLWPDYPDGADFSITAGTSLYELLTDYCEQLDATWRMLPNFRLWVEQNNGNNVSDKVVFNIGGHQQSQNRKRSRREIVNHLYIYSERKNGAHVSEMSDGDSVTKWRRREQWVEANNAGASARNQIGLATLGSLKDERNSREIKVPYDSPGRRIFVDYDVNDWVTVETDTGDNGDSVMQVLTATVRVNKEGVDLELTLGTRFDAREIKVQKALDKTSSGTSIGSMVATPAKRNSTRSSIMSTKIDDLANISVTAPATGDTFIYNSTTQVFEAVPNAYESLTDVDMTTIPPADGEVPTWDGTNGVWVPGAGGGGGGGGAWQPVASGSFSGAPEVIIDGLNSSDYDDYQIDVVYTGSSVSAVQVFARLRAAGADLTTANYAWSWGRTFSNMAIDGYGYTDTRWLWGRCPNTGIGPEKWSTRLQGIHLAEATGYMADGAFKWNSEAGGRQLVGGIYDAATVADGIRFYPNSGTFSGRWVVYGLRKTIPTSAPSQDRRWTAETVHAQNDEFNDGALAAAWTRVDAAGESSFLEMTEGADSLSIRAATGDDGAGPKLHGLVKPYALAVGEYVQCHIRTSGRQSNYPAFGLVVSDGASYGAGNQHVSMFIPASGFYGVTHGAWTNWNSRTAGFADTVLPAGMVEFHYRMKRDTGNVWRVYQSTDGVVWDELSTHTHALTPTHVGLVGTGWGSTTPRTFSVDYFRVGS